MKVHDEEVNTYVCEESEDIKITFELSPQNVAQIVARWDNTDPQDVDVEEGIRKAFSNSRMRLRLTFGFIQQGTCYVYIAGNDGDPVDEKEVSGDELTEIELFFVPDENTDEEEENDNE